MLTADQLRAELHYDPVTGVFTRLVARCNKIDVGDVAGTVMPNGRRQISVLHKTYLAHRLAWLYMTGDWPPGELDHRDLDGDHNWWSNLRLATRTQNQANTRARKHNQLGLKNVVKRGNRFRLRVTIDGKRVNVGQYGSIEEACAVHAELALKHNGEYARVT